MLTTLADQFNGVVAICQPRLYDRIVLELRRDRFGDQNGSLMTLTVMAIDLQYFGMIANAVNLIQPTPFDGKALDRLAAEMCEFSSPGVDNALRAVRTGLHKLTTWVEAKEILDGKAVDETPDATRSDAERARAEILECGETPNDKNVLALLKEWKLRPRFVEFTDAQRAFETVCGSGQSGTKATFVKYLRSWGFAIGSDRAQQFFSALVRESAVRPQKTAD